MEMRTDSEEFENLDYADKWLARYTYENLDKWPGQDILDTLAERYPIKTSMTVYRGMNFSTKERWDEFEKELNTGSVNFHGISSWGRNPKSVEQFAVTRPSYFMDRDTMREYGKARSEREFVSGYRGIVLSVVLEPGQAIDVNASKLGHEDEIIALPGTYPVKIQRYLKRYRDMIDDGDTNIDDVILGTSDQPYDSGFRDYVLHHHSDQLNDAARKHLYLKQLGQLRVKPGSIRYDIREPISRYHEEGTPTYCHVFYAAQYFAFAIAGLYLPEDQLICKKQAKQAISQIISLISTHPTLIFKELRSVSELAKFCGMTAPYAAALKKHIGRQYRELEEIGRTFNKRNFKDAWEMKSELAKHGDRVAEVLNQLRG